MSRLGDGQSLEWPVHATVRSCWTTGSTSVSTFRAASTLRRQTCAAFAIAVVDGQASTHSGLAVAVNIAIGEAVDSTA